MDHLSARWAPGRRPTNKQPAHNVMRVIIGAYGKKKHSGQMMTKESFVTLRRERKGL